jgi:hypothetical protein
MYKCKECNAEYKIKPDYCDCGNDTFDYIEEVVPTQHQTLTLEQKSEIISRVFFALCLLFAILVWFIPVAQKTQHQTKQKTNTVTTSTNIPDISKIWKDTPVKTESVTQSTQQVQPIQQEPIILTPTAPVQKKNLTSNVVKPQNTTPVQTQKPKAVEKTVEKVTQKPVQKTVTTPTSTPVVVKEPVKTVDTPKKVEPAKTVYNPNSTAMVEYKTKLRAKLFSKFAVGSIQGSGNCTISFAIDSNGKLINRKFVKESDNKSLNDAVYYMLMSVPNFSVPPAGYNGETIKMHFVINNGNYEISIY